MDEKAEEARPTLPCNHSTTPASHFRRSHHCGCINRAQAVLGVAVMLSDGYHPVELCLLFVFRVWQMAVGGVITGMHLPPQNGAHPSDRANQKVTLPSIARYKIFRLRHTRNTSGSSSSLVNSSR